MTTIIKIQEEIKKELADANVMKALVATTFKGLAVPQIYLAIREGMLRGFDFKDFLEKNVYAIPFENKRTGKQEYSLITSIDYARKIAMRSGLAGKSAPIFTFTEKGDLETCTVTIKRNVDGYVGEYTATVYFNEYSTGRNLWINKPKTMLAKVAEMHALRAGFPEEMAKQYIEEEVQKEAEKPKLDLEPYQTKLEATKSGEELKKVWASLPSEAKKELLEVKNNLKKQHENPQV